MLPPGPEGDVMLMDVLLIATGFSGALTVLWLARLVARVFHAAAGATAHFAPGPGPVDALVREIGVARRDVHLMAGALACRPVAQALVDARLRQVQVDVLLDAAAEKDPDSDLHFLVQQGLVPLLAAEPSGLRGLVVVVDGKTVVSGSVDGTAESPAGHLLVVRGHADLAASCRQQLAGLRGPARAVGGMAAPSPPQADEATAAAQPVGDELAPTAATGQEAAKQKASPEDLLAAVARGLTAQEEDPSPGSSATQATDELFTHLPQEADGSEEDDSAGKAA
jgi:hypothetical protein